MVALGIEQISEVRAADYARFLAIQLAPPAERAALYTLTAFAVELARIAETVSEPLLGHIRLAWWREGLEELRDGKGARSHPVMLALAGLCAANPELLPLLLRMVEAHAVDLDSSLLDTPDAWQRYLDHTAGALHTAWAQVLDAAAAAAHADLVAQQARGYAIVGHLCAIPYMHSQGLLRFPQSSLAAAGLESLAPQPALAGWVEQLLQEATPMLLSAPALPRSLKPLTGLLRLAQLRRRMLVRHGFDPYRLPPARLAQVLKIMQVRFFLC